MIISFSGKKRTGKDTAAEHVISTLGYERLSFADPLKEFCAEAFGIPVEHFKNDDLKDVPFRVSIQLYSSEIIQIIEDMILLEELHIGKIPWSEIPTERNLKTPREILQFVGTELGRNIVSENIWINQLRKKLSTGNYVISDTRMSNEREFLRTVGAKLILIIRDTGLVDGHESENSLGDPSEYDAVLYNFGTVDDLRRHLDDALRR